MSRQYRDAFLTELAELMEKYNVYITAYEPHDGLRSVEFDIGCPVDHTRQDIEIYGTCFNASEVRGYIGE